MSENLESLQEGFYLKNKAPVYLKRDWGLFNRGNN